MLIEEHKVQLIKLLLRILKLPENDLSSVRHLGQEVPALSVNNCFAYILPTIHKNWIFVPGDRRLRKKAESREVTTHDMFWCIDEIYKGLRKLSIS